jgi:hypothetical protein
MISIPPTLTLGSIDTLLKKVLDAPEAGLRFPAKIELRSMLSSAAYIQFLLTWARFSNNREVQFTVAKHEHLPFLASAPETVLPLLLAKKASFRLGQSNIFEPIDITDLKNKGLDIFAPIEGGGIQKSLFGNDEPEFNDIPSKGPKVHLLAADGEFSHAYPNWFYSGARESRQIRDADDLSSLVRNVLNLIRNHSINRYGSWVDGLSENLGSMLYELIDNTHKWGRQNTSGEPIAMFRGALFDVKFDHPGDKTRMANIATDIPLIADFVTYHSQQPQTRNLGLMEMSVFDGGIGLPTRELLRRGQVEPTIQQEYEATLSCLKKWGTTSGQKGRGLGLDRVLELASSRQGFVYLRTGRIVLYRDFANQPTSSQEESNKNLAFEKHMLFDGASQGNTPTENISVCGTLLSVILPFSASNP